MRGRLKQVGVNRAAFIDGHASLLANGARRIAETGRFSINGAQIRCGDDCAGLQCAGGGKHGGLSGQGQEGKQGGDGMAHHQRTCVVAPSI